MHARGGELHVVLPFSPDAFLNTSVAIPGADSWIPRFERILEIAVDLTLAQRLPRDTSGGEDYERGNRLMTELARQKAAFLGAAVSGLVVWNGKTGDGIGGTSSMVEHSRELGLEVGMIDPGQWL